MSITYTASRNFTQSDLQDLFLSVSWSSGHFPEKLFAAMKNYETVISAWDGGRLVELLKDRYRDYLRLMLLSYDAAVPFYESCGFKVGAGEVPMFITELWT